LKSTSRSSPDEHENRRTGGTLGHSCIDHPLLRKRRLAAEGAAGRQRLPGLQANALDRLDLIQLGQKLGFSLDTIRNVAALHGTALKDALLGQLDARLQEIDRLHAILDEQRRSVVSARERVLEAPANGDCRVQAAWTSDECLKSA
jgi:hypothetical protein